jgi:hypothetical protein
MTYLFTEDQEIKNEIGNPISISKNTTTNSSDNPIFVSLGSETITITGDVNVGTAVEITNDEGSPIPTHTHLYDESDNEYTASNPLTIDGTVTALQGTDPWTVDGTVELGATTLSSLENINATVSGTVSVDNFPETQTVDGNVGVTGNVNVTQGTDPWVVSGNVTATISGGVGEISFPTTQTDAFGRLRVSNPVTVFDAQNRYVDGEQFSSDNSGSGSVTYNANSSNFTLSVTGNGDEVIRQAKRVTLYQPGKSLLIMNTFAFNTPTNNLRQRVGYFTAQNGIFLEADGTSINIVKRSYTTGSAVDTKVTQASWNGDVFDGTGVSGITLDVSKTHILWTDIEWLGVGSVRVGFVINGVFYVAHTFHHANSLTDVYMTTASLNCRYEITSTGASGSMRQICSTVISEGGYSPTPPIRSVSNGTVEKRLSSADTLYPLATIRLDPNTPDCVVMPAQIDFLATDVTYGEIQLVEGATLTGASFNNNESTTVETDTSATAMSGGNRVYSALWASRVSLNLEETVKKRLQLAREADGTPITLTFAAASTSSNADILYKFGWEELSN